MGAVFGWTALACGLFMLAAWAGSAVPRNSGWTEPQHGVEIMVETNGVHTALVLPLVTPEKDLRGIFSPSVLPLPDKPYTHVSVGWGEREVFLNTPTWADLSPLTLVRILGAGGDGLLHLTYYVRPAPSADMRPIRLTPEQYVRLVAAIQKLAKAPDAPSYRGYGANDVFYDAPGRYTAANTCNQWTSDMLAAAGVRTGWWTPFAGGVMKWLPPLES